LKGTWHEKSWNPRSYHPKFITAGLNGKLWKEKEMRKVGIYDLTIQSSCLQLIEKETLKEIRRVWKGKGKTHFEHPGVDFANVLSRGSEDIV
jgi:hypothetical protein